MCDVVFVHMCVTVCEEPCEGKGGGGGEVGPLLQIGYLNVSCQINDTCTRVFISADFCKLSFMTDLVLCNV